MRQQDKVEKSPYNLLYLYCFLTLLALNLPHFSSLEVSSLDLKRVLQGKVTARSFLHA